MENPESLVEDKNNAAPISRPGRVTILALGVLIITILNLLRLVLSISNWDFLNSWPRVSPWYMVLTGLVWSLTGSLLFWGLWTAKKWAPKLMEAVSLTYALYYWMDHIFLMNHPVSGVVGTQRILLPVNWKFAAGVTALCLMYIAWTLSRSRVKAYFNQEGSKVDPVL